MSGKPAGTSVTQTGKPEGELRGRERVKRPTIPLFEGSRFVCLKSVIFGEIQALLVSASLHC